jgi:hypothetical protein
MKGQVMNSKQKLSLWVGIILFLVANSYAPWNYTGPAAGTEELIRVPAGHFCIFDTPELVSDKYSGLEVDMSRVAIQSAMIVLFTFVLAATFSERRAKSD